jgi:hypothetical protein
MIKPLFFFFFSSFAYNRIHKKLVYKSNGNILDSESKNFTINRELLKDNQKLASYNDEI